MLYLGAFNPCHRANEQPEHDADGKARGWLERTKTRASCRNRGIRGMDVSNCARGLFQSRKAANVVGMSMSQDNMPDIAGLSANFTHGLEYLFAVAGIARVNQRKP